MEPPRADLAPGAVRAHAAYHTVKTGAARRSVVVKWDTGGDSNCPARSPSYAQIADYECLLKRPACKLMRAEHPFRAAPVGRRSAQLEVRLPAAAGQASRAATRLSAAARQPGASYHT
jgi:hypothetical protein